MNIKRFDRFLQETLERYQQGGFIVGDRVKFKKNALSMDFFKNKSESFKKIIASYIEPTFDLNLRIGALKSQYPTTAYHYHGESVPPNSVYADVYVEYAPGLYARPMTVPIEALELQDDGNNRGPIPDSVKRKSRVHGPEEITNQQLPTKNKPISNKKSWNDKKPGGGNVPNSIYSKGR